MSPVTYVKARGKYAVTPLVKTMTEGKAGYRSVIIAKSDSKIHAVKDIRGKRFAFGTSHSVSSYISPRVMLLNAGIELKDLLHYEFLGTHEDVINAVIQGTFDAGAVSESMASRHKDKGIKFIEFSGEMPGFIISAHKKMPRNMQESLAKALLELKDTTPEGLSVLQAIDKRYSGFTSTSDDEIRTLHAMMGKLGLL